jgi:hypothetical protein
MPPLGFITPSQRTQAQRDAHERAMRRMPRLAMPRTPVPKGTKILLTDYWKHPDCVADMGAEFTGFGQYTGSCVGVSEGDALCTLSCVQRVVGDKSTKAFIPWWPFPYGRTRYNEGDRGQGEGAVDSVMGETLKTEGVFDIGQAGLPSFGKRGPDGFWLSQSLELQWSDGARIDQKWRDLAKQYPVQGITVLNSPDDIRDAIVNGYPVLDGCDNYIGHGSIKGEGELAYVVGHYDGRGGHSTCFLGYWNHPNDGPLFLYSNQWDTSTYPRDPAGGGRCCTWTPESEVEKLFRTGGDRGETMALSHLTWFPAQPKVLTWNW